MPDIFHDLVVLAPCDRVFDAFSTPRGLDSWWTLSSSGEPRLGAEFSLFFGPGYDWRGRVVKCAQGKEFEIEITSASPDWIGTRVGCRLEAEEASLTRVRFHHTGWPSASEHWRVSCYCWAMYLRLMRRWIEHGEIVPYESRLDA